MAGEDRKGKKKRIQFRVDTTQRQTNSAGGRDGEMIKYWMNFSLEGWSDWKDGEKLKEIERERRCEKVRESEYFIGVVSG